MTSDKLQGYTKKQLAEMARKKGVAGWHGMRKEDLIASLASGDVAFRQLVEPFILVRCAQIGK